MPYCSKCGAKLADDARFCQVCGTPVTSPVAAAPRTPPPREPARKTQFPLGAIILIAILISAVVAAFVVLLPFQPVNFSQQNEASAANINRVYFSLEADVADISVRFKDLPGNQKVRLNTSATGWRSIFGSDQPLALSFEEDTANGSLIYIVKLSKAEGLLLYQDFNVFCDVLVDPSVSLDLSLRANTGPIEINADKAVNITSLSAQTTAGYVNVTLAEGAVVAGPISVRASTSAAYLTWDDADVQRSTTVNVASASRLTYVNITQTKQLSGNVTVNVGSSNAGFITLWVTVKDEVGANISAPENMGGVALTKKGFSGNNLPIHSSNYPSQSNFLINLQRANQGADVHAVYELTGVRS